METPVPETITSAALIDEDSLLAPPNETLGYPDIRMDGAADVYPDTPGYLNTDMDSGLGGGQDGESGDGSDRGRRHVSGWRRAGYVTGTAALVALAAACGSSASSSSAAPTPKPAAGASASPSPLRTTPPASVAPGNPNTPAPPLVEQMCTTGNLGVELGSTSGTAGGNYVTVEFKNLGLTACWLTGYPGVSAWNGGQIGESAVRNPAVQPNRVSISPGSIAISYVKITDPGVYSPGECQPEQATNLKVIPPNFYDSWLLPYKFTACKGPVPLLHVEATETIPAAG